MNDATDTSFSPLLFRIRAMPIEHDEDPCLLEKCDRCGFMFPLRFIRFTGLRFLCPTCEATDPDPEVK